MRRKTRCKGSPWQEAPALAFRIGRGAFVEVYAALNGDFFSKTGAFRESKKPGPKPRLCN
jgi:hypothetical protein